MIKNNKELLDRYLVLPFLALTCLSLVFIYSSSNVMANEIYSDPYFFFKRQLLALSIALIASAIFIFIPTSFYRDNGAILVLVSILLLFVVALPFVGTEVNGSRRWLNLRIFNLQPSEVAKIFIPIYLCGYCLRRKEQLETKWRGFLKPLVLVAMCCILLLLEPDVGATAVLFAVSIIILFLGGAKTSQLIMLALIFFALISTFVYFDEERFSRVLSFSDPFDDPFGTDYQLLNALIASVQGGIFGMGVGESTQKYFFLPEAHTDFIFSIYVEESGILGLIILTVIYSVILYRLYLLAKESAKKNFFFIHLLINSFFLIFFIQTLLNIFVNLGLLPTKGLALPFMSYGRSSVIMNFIALAITLRASWELRNNIR